MWGGSGAKDKGEVRTVCKLKNEGIVQAFTGSDYKYSDTEILEISDVRLRHKTWTSKFAISAACPFFMS